MTKNNTNYHRLNIYNRMDIQAAIHDGKTISEIARMLNVHRSTISRELKRIISKTINCPKLKRIATCNICEFKYQCDKKKLYYDYKVRNDEAKKNKTFPREKSQLSIYKIKEINDIVSPLIYKGQSIHHIYASDKRLQSLCSERTIRRLIYRNELTAKAHQLRRYVRFKHPLPKKEKPIYIRDIKYLINRKYPDFLRYKETHKKENIVEYDSVIGKLTDMYAILTITLVEYSFQFGLVIYKSNPKDVIAKLHELFNKIGPKAKDIFKINLCDNGIEFYTFYEIEKYVGRVFYADPYKSSDKPHCERNHEFIRYVYPKGKSLNTINQNDLNEVFSNINSYVRESLGDETPYDLVKEAYGEDFLNAIKIRRIENKKVRLTQLI